MDDQRFDQLARTLGKATGRRHVLRGLGLFTIGGLFARGTAAQEIATCTHDSDCPTSGDPCTGVTCEDGACATFIVDCAPGFTCCGNGDCCDPDGACQSDADCTDTDGDPCTGGRCEAGSCTYRSVTCAPGFTCCGNGDCCESTPTCLFDADCPNTSGDPCTTTSCVDGLCVARIVDCAIGSTCCAGGCVPGCPAGHTLDQQCRCTSPGGDPTGGSPDVSADSDDLLVTSGNGTVSASTGARGVSATSGGRTVTVGSTPDAE